MKKSRYNFIRPADGQSVLYNARTEALAILNPEVAKLYEENAPAQIKRVHPEFYDYLRENNFLVADDFDELEAQLAQWKESDDDPSHFSIGFNPTLCCNLRCWYCYENHEGNLNMTPDVFERMQRLITRRMQNPELVGMSLDFFGGEPLLNFGKIGRPLIEHACREASKYEKYLSITFVTNGVLLSEDILKFLADTGHSIAFQITLDGNRERHDSIRNTRTGGPTYNTILHNVARVLEYPEMFVTLRCNYTAESLASFADVAADISRWKENPAIIIEHLTIDPHRVWQDHAKTTDIDIQAADRDVRAAFKEAGVRVSVAKRANRYRCYADRHNHLHVNFNGDVYRCTARDFTPDRSEGILTTEGEVEWNEKSAQRDAVKWNNETCRECEIYPLCCGTCSQNKLESGRTSGCEYGYSSDDKANIITERIAWLINGAKKSSDNNI